MGTNYGERITLTDIERAGKRLADKLGVHWGHYQRGPLPDGYPIEREGVYLHDHGDGTYSYTIEGSLGISQQYGGVALHRIHETGGTGITDVFRSGHVPKRELWIMIRAALDGVYLSEWVG